LLVCWGPAVKAQRLEVRGGVGRGEGVGCGAPRCVNTPARACASL